ncbi:TPA: hypothetical protein ACH3X3_013180 [Trebouxia sp. C0006]
MIKPCSGGAFLSQSHFIARNIMSHPHDISLALRNFQERFLAEGQKDDCGEAQELLRHIEELSRELYRLEGGCESSSSLRIRKFPAGARPSPISCGVIQTLLVLQWTHLTQKV